MIYCAKYEGPLIHYILYSILDFKLVVPLGMGCLHLAEPVFLRTYHVLYL